jgi:hypothetical protein
MYDRLRVMDERGEPDMAMRESPVAGYGDERGMARDDQIYLAFALIAGALLALWYAPLGLVTIWVFTAAAWVRHRHAAVRWVLTAIALLLLLGVLFVSVTS